METPPPPAIPTAIITASELLTAAGLGDASAHRRLAELCDRFPNRLSGSDGLEQAIDWSLAQMKADGLENVRREKVMIPRWVRGRESARLVSPVEYDLAMLGLGNSVGTPKQGIRAEIVPIDTVEAIDGLGDRAKGKIVLVTSKMQDFDHERHKTGYGEAVKPRIQAASRAAKIGAKAVLIRSVTATSLRSPHTGALRYEDGVAKIPAAALAHEDVELLMRHIARGEKVEVTLKMEAKTLPDRESANAVAELRGRELPDEVVVLGCHIDAWDVGQGAHDDGAGCVMVMEAMRMLKANGLVPRRTIRAVLYTNEENGLRGGRAYAEAHAAEKHVAAVEADFGSFAPRGFGIGGSKEQVEELRRFAPLFEKLGASIFDEGGGGADIGPLMEKGVLGIGVSPDGSRYFDLHHSHADTVDKVKPEDIQRNAAAMALMGFLLAER
jgi:carboxypeptidase Q